MRHRFLRGSCVTRSGLLIALIAGLAAHLMEVSKIYLGSTASGSIVSLHEALLLISASLAGPLAGLLTAIMAAIAYPIEELRNFQLIEHVLAVLVVGWGYKMLVHDRLRMPLFLVAWVALIFTATYVVPSLFIIAAASVAPFLHSVLPLGDLPLIETLPVLWMDWSPEFAVSTLITSGVWLALPARFRSPLWGRPSAIRKPQTDSAPTHGHRGYLGVRLGVWIALLSILPMVLGGIFTLQTFEQVVFGRGFQSQLYLVRTLAHHIAASGHQDLAQFVPPVPPPAGYIMYFADSTGHRSEPVEVGEVTPLMRAVLSEQVVGKLFTGRPGWTVDAENKLFIGSAPVEGMRQRLVIVSNYADGGRKIAELNWIMYRNVGISVLVVSLLTGLVMWVIVVRPLKLLTDASEKIGNGELDISIRTETMDDEVRLLGDSLQGMAWNLRSMNKGLTEEVRHRREAERALRQSEERYRLLSDAALEALLVVEGTIVRDANKQAVAMCGYDVEEILGLDIRELLRSEKVPAQKVDLAAASPGPLECTCTTKEGKALILEVYMRQVRAENEDVAIVICRDITERRSMERRSRILAEAVESAGECIVVTDPAGDIIYVNGAFQRTFGYSDSELLGRKIDIVSASSDPPGMQEEIMLATSQGGWQGEVMNVRKDGSEFPIILTTSVVRDEHGQAIAFVSLSRDITAQKAQERQIRRMNEELEKIVEERTADLTEAMKELESFSYSVSHDLRAPLRHIAGFSEMAQDHFKDVTDDTGRRYLETVRESAVRLGHLIDQLLAFSRIGRAEVRRIPVDLNQLLTEVRNELAHEEAGRIVDWKVAPLPTVAVDPVLFRQALSNLVANALKFTRKKEMASIEVGCLMEDRGECILFIRDNGAGFDMKYADKLFGVFQRLHADHDYEGSGIGLANVKKVVQRHGGRIWAESVEDEGTTFFLTVAGSIEVAA